MTKKPKNQRKEVKKKKKKSRVWGKILLFLLVILTAIVVFFVYKTHQNGGGLQGLLSTLVGHDEETLKNLEPIQVLLMGKSIDEGAELTDTIIIGSYNPKAQKASLLSIPRDTFVGKKPSAGTGGDKINAAYRKSPEKALEAVNGLTGLDIKYYMVIDNQALIELVDVIGGVEFDVPYVEGGMVYDDTSQDLHINLQSGWQVIDGNEAEQLLRFRKNNKGKTYSKEYGGDDYGRMRTQREFIMATAKQTLQAKNILKIKDIIDIVYEYVETNLSIATIKDYVPYAINIDLTTIETAVLPGASYGPPTYPLWFFIADKKETAELIEQLYSTGEDEPSEGTDGESSNGDTITNDEPNVDTNPITTVEVNKKEASEIKIELINGTGSSNVLSEAKKLLEKQGYQVTTKTTTSTSKTTIINKTNVDKKFTDNIKGVLGVGNISTSVVSSSNVDITIILGKDYNK